MRRRARIGWGVLLAAGVGAVALTVFSAPITNYTRNASALWLRYDLDSPTAVAEDNAATARSCTPFGDQCVTLVDPNGLPYSATGGGGGGGDVNLTQVNTQPVNVGTGAAGTGTQRVALADESLTFSLNQTGAANNVDIASLPSIVLSQSGTSNDVDVATIAAGNNNIGDVDVASLPALPAGTNNIGDVDVLSAPYTATEDAAETDAAQLVRMGAVRRDVRGTSASANGENATINVDSAGSMWVRSGSVARTMAFTTDLTSDTVVDPATNRLGATWSIGGSPGSENLYFKWSAGTAPADQIIRAVSAGALFVLTEYHVSCSIANTPAGGINVLLEWDDTADVPFDGRDGIPAGGGWQVGSGAGALRSGADGQDLFLTATDPVGGSCTFSGRGFEIAS